MRSDARAYVSLGRTMKRRLRPWRAAFTMLETLIALALATLIIMTIMNALVTSNIHVQHDTETLEYLHKATVLLEYLKRDVRSALSEKDSVQAGSTVVIRRSDDRGGAMTVTYKYEADRCVVIRSVQGRGEKTFGAEGNSGIITVFALKEVDDKNYKGFFQAEVAFSPRRRRLKDQEAGRKPRPIHRFRVLINRRTPDSRDDRWNRAFSATGSGS